MIADNINLKESVELVGKLYLKHPKTLNSQRIFLVNFFSVHVHKVHLITKINESSRTTDISMQFIRSVLNKLDWLPCWWPTLPLPIQPPKQICTSTWYTVHSYGQPNFWLYWTNEEHPTLGNVHLFTICHLLLPNSNHLGHYLIKATFNKKK